MKADLKAKWVEALRSGKYEQGRGALLNDGKYCCLGVLCEVVGLEIIATNRLAGDAYPDHSYRRIEGIIGIESEVLTRRNDGDDDPLLDGAPAIEPHTFEALADYIEANIPADDHSVTEPT